MKRTENQAGSAKVYKAISTLEEAREWDDVPSIAQMDLSEVLMEHEVHDSFSPAELRLIRAALIRKAGEAEIREAIRQAQMGHIGTRR